LDAAAGENDFKTLCQISLILDRKNRQAHREESTTDGGTRTGTTLATLLAG
jgi:hypothetical protein